MYRHDAESLSLGHGSPVTCAACGCRLEAASGARDGEYHHFQPFNGRDARGCRVDCVELVHDATGRPVLASIA
jgi:hypothetical protein